ncbi:hypothetical protein [Nevskia sp.]|uniref:hypothetical protein n=1 Tax=Nevskia sp. TaxID=1929292 RepID=UPI0025E7047E|nr:hypothetical protein [Nevskia sp.]
MCAAPGCAAKQDSRLRVCEKQLRYHPKPLKFMRIAAARQRVPVLLAKAGSEADTAFKARGTPKQKADKPMPAHVVRVDTRQPDQKETLVD